MSASTLPRPSSAALRRRVRVPRVARRPADWPSARVAWLIVAAITLAAVPLHISRLHVHFWVDEGIAVGIARHPLAQLPALLRQDGSPPLYYALLHVWMQLFGHGEPATHLLSCLFALVAVPVAYWAATGIAGRRAGLYAAALTAGLPFLVAYAQETRMYSLLLLLSLVVAGSFVRAFVHGRRRFGPLFALSLAATLYTHNWGLFLTLAALVAFAIVLWRRPAPDRRALARDGALCFAGAGLLYLPWLPILIDQAQHTGAPWAASPTLWSITQGTYVLTGSRAASVALALGAGSGLLARDRRLRGAALTTAIALAVLGFGSLLIAWLYAKHTPAWADRYLAVTAGPLLLLFAIGLRRAGRLGLVVLLLITSFWVLDPVPSALSAKSNVAAVAAHLHSQLGPDPLVLSTQPEQVPVLHYYLPSVRRFVTPLGASPDPGLLDWREALPRFERATLSTSLTPALRTVRPGQRILLVVPVNSPKTPRWSLLIRRSSARWLRYLESDRALRLIARSDAGVNQAGIAPVRAYLFSARYS